MMKNNLQKAYQHSKSNFRFYQIISENLTLIPVEQLRTLLALNKFMPNAYPSLETLSEMTGRSVRTVIRDIQKLESLQIISVKREHRRPNIYNFILGDTALSLKTDLGCQNEEVRVTKTALLGDRALSPHHIKNILINSKDNLNLVDNSCVLVDNLVDKSDRENLAVESKKLVETLKKNKSRV